MIGAPERIRTSDLCLRRAALYPAELRVFAPLVSKKTPVFNVLTLEGFWGFYKGEQQNMATFRPAL